MVAEKITRAAASVRAVAAQSDAHAAAFEAQRQAAAQREAAEQTRLRTTAAHRAEGLRGQWQQASDRLHREHATRIAGRHEQMKRTVQDSVLHTENQADQHLGDTEARSDRVLADASGRAAGIRAQGQLHPQAGPNLEGGGGGSTESEAAKVLEEAQRLVQDMLTAARQHNMARVEELRRQVAQLLAEHATELQTFIAATLTQFPLIGQFYQQQIDELMALVQGEAATIARAYSDGDRAIGDALIAKLTHDLSLMNRYFGEVQTIAGYGGDLEQLRAAFGITLDDKWREEGKNYEEIALLAAITTEHAFRRSATDGQMDDFGFGAGFQAVFGQMNLTFNSTQPYLRDHVAVGSVVRDGVTVWFTYDADDANQTHIREYQTQEAAQNGVNRDRGPYGAYTSGTHEIEWYQAAFTAGDRNPNYLLYNVIHEFGHAFNLNAHGLGYTVLGNETIMATVNGERTRIAGKNTNDDAGRHFGEAYGISPYPYQQSVQGKTGEDFADMFLNWVENSFADNDAGRARFHWMDRHMWGDTSQRGVEGEQRWGLADTAIDRNSASSKWVPPDTEGGSYRVRPGETLQRIASRFGIEAAAIQTANAMGNSTDLSAFPVLILPGVTQDQIDQSVD